MKRKLFASLAIVVSAASVIVVMGQSQTTKAQITVVTTGQVSEADRVADREAIMKAAGNYAEAFNKGDAKAIAAMWTDNAECREASGNIFVGRAAIEKAHAEMFKQNPEAKLNIIVKTIRFPARDLAIEEGLLRNATSYKVLPTSTTYMAIHVRENGTWKMALSSEGGAGQDRLEDLEWLLGDWTTKLKNGSDVKLSFVVDTKKMAVIATFTKSKDGKDPVSGSIRIQKDPETGKLRSWGFEDDGAHSQGLWHNDGKGWVVECHGVLADGTPTSETILLQRVAVDAVTWRVTDRILGGEPVADTVPMRLTRAK
ncbi:hypothetical protein BH11PLA2_BH11PLA2_25690 [soil metagenome]